MSDWHEDYKRRYADLKKAGKSFFPYAVFKDICVVILILIALCAVAHFIGAQLEDIADPTDATYNPRPEWYFLALFQALKLFPGRLEALGALGLPGLLILGLITVPLLDRGPQRHPLDRPFWSIVGLLVVSVILYLTWAGYRSPMINPIVEKDPAAMAGQRVYRDMKCFYCHAINGQGGRLAPDLAQLGHLASDDWLTRHFKDPRSVSPNSQMPKMNLLDEEIQSLIAYLKTLNVNEGFSPDAPKLFTQNCAVCHRVGKEGNDLGPDLSATGSARDRRYIQRYISNPGAIYPKSVMPIFKGQMTDDEIEDLAKYLASLK